MIEPMMATMLGFVTTDAAVDAGAAAARCSRGRRRHVQRHHRRRRVLDQRLRVLRSPTARAASRSTRRSVPAPSTAGLERGVPRAGARDRARRRGRDQAGDRPRDRRGTTQRRQAGGAQPIANSPLVKTAMHGGDPNWGRLVAAAGPSGRAVRAANARRARSGPSCCFEDGRPHDERAPRPPSTCKGTDIDIERRPRHGRRRTRRRCGRATSAPSTCGSTGSTGHEPISH